MLLPHDVRRETGPLNVEYSREFLRHLLCDNGGRRGGLQNLGHRRDTALCEATGHNKGKREEVKIDVERKSVNCDSVIDPDSDRANLRVSLVPAHPDAGVLLHAITFNPPSRECMDEDLFQFPYILLRS